ncbi:nucleotidyl transferase AbiEii/AbiGii toxin family protein [Marispirochaeta aestuarii]|uniref:nucleotidyl transferase AbiEii/AbiGii toxin family protein n=1 Tax=Marispirochaeta aestuarii TaxID=1963862 RepID=UPI0018E9A743|nr:nucleotidyl transferase AbiEii/AbiGii toxin family protein [Marispirochaeta aestuarii]
MKEAKNVAASVRQRLLNLSKAENRPFTEVLQYYGMERFLYRLSQSRYADRFILKGALMLRVWQSPQHRPTMDIDLLGHAENSPEKIEAQVREILAVEVDSDGVLFYPETISSEEITQEAEYSGVRVFFRGTLDTARINFQLDIGFGDSVYPAPRKSSFPTLLEHPAPSMFCYSRESAIAEKLEAMVKHGYLNSRMKDFFDIWLLSRQFSFEGPVLAEALSRTFKQRGTTVSADLPVTEDRFITEKQIQWSAFRRRMKLEYIPASFEQIAQVVLDFLIPVVTALSHESLFSMQWTPAHGWQ